MKDIIAEVATHFKGCEEALQLPIMLQKGGLSFRRKNYTIAKLNCQLIYKKYRKFIEK
jgi:hypothetical protein